MNSKFLVPIGRDNSQYFDIFERYKNYIGGVYIGWPGAPSGRIGASPSKKFFDKVFAWCVKNNKVFDVLFNMQAHDFASGFKYEKLDLKPYKHELTQLTFSSITLYLEKIFSGFKKSISTNFQVNSAQKLYALYKHLPGLKSVVLDRDINRDQRLVNEINKLASKRNLYLDIMVNEGCISFCPYKIDHNIFVTLAQFSDQDQYIKKVKNICLDYFKKDFSNLLKSPFLTRETLKYYKCRFFKIVGRKKSPQLIDDLLAYYIFNQPIDIGMAFCNKSMPIGIMSDKLPGSFHQTILNCRNKCYQCGICSRTYGVLKTEKNKMS